MPSTTIFLLGATGYLGSQFLVDLSKQYPDFHVVALVRGAAEREAAVRTMHPKTTVMEGSLDDANVIREAAAKADVVVNCASSDHLGGVQGVYQECLHLSDQFCSFF